MSVIHYISCCPRCQTGGKVLADRSLSRRLKDDWPKSIEELEEQQQKRQKLMFNLEDEEAAKPMKSAKTAGRNDPCPCGSGKKFKKCCGA